MDIDGLRELAKGLMGRRKSHLYREVGAVYHHGQRAARLALTLRRQIFPDISDMDGVIAAACMFHDIGKGIEPHDRYGAVLAREALSSLVTASELDIIVHIIDRHTHRKDGQSYPWYVQLVQDADLLDHIGGYEMWMNIQYHAHNEGCMDDLFAFYAPGGEYEKQMEVQRTLTNYPETLKEMNARDEAFRGYIAQMEREHRGAL